MRDRVVKRPEPAARWSTTLLSKVNFHTAINFRALYGANLVTYPAELRRVKTRVLNRVDAVTARQLVLDRVIERPEPAS